MYCTQDRIYCGFCYKSILPDNYAIKLGCQIHVNNPMKNQCTNSMIIKHIVGKK